MKTCGQCVHLEFARGITGRPLRVKAGKCGGRFKASKLPISFCAYDPNKSACSEQVRPTYHDSQMASQCAAFKEKQNNNTRSKI